jgi:hypothetical protein
MTNYERNAITHNSSYMDTLQPCTELKMHSEQLILQKQIPYETSNNTSQG